MLGKNTRVEKSNTSDIRENISMNSKKSKLFLIKESKGNKA